MFIQFSKQANIFSIMLGECFQDLLTELYLSHSPTSGKHLLNVPVTEKCLLIFNLNPFGPKYVTMLILVLSSLPFSNILM